VRNFFFKEILAVSEVVTWEIKSMLKGLDIMNIKNAKMIVKQFLWEYLCNKRKN